MAKTVRSKIDITKINAIAELERCGWDYTPSGAEEIKCKCPVHDDNNPSVSLNVVKNLWQCQASSCKAHGDIVTLLAFILQSERGPVLVGLSERYDLNTVKVVNPEMIEKHHENIWNSGPLLQALYDRGVIESDIRTARLGYSNGRIMIPIYDIERRVINIRRYLPGAPGSEKMRNMRGYNTLELYQVEQTGYNTIWVCGGEMKALVAKRFLNPLGVGATTVTGGEGSWDVKFNSLFKDKVIYVCMDIDSGGVIAAKKIASQLVYYASAVYIIHLPLESAIYPKGDMNDWVGKEKADTADFKACMENAIKFKVEVEDEKIEGEAIEVTLVEATHAEYVGKRVVCDAMITAMDTTPYIIPYEVNCSCTRDQADCIHCPVRHREPNEQTGKVLLKVNPTSSGILEMVNAPKKSQKEALKSALSIPGCKIVEFKIESHYNVLDVRLTPQLQITGDNADYVVQPALIVNSQIDLNIPYTLTGRVYPHPKNQQAILLINIVEQGADSLTSFEPTSKDLKKLEIFKPKIWSVAGIQKQLDDIYLDMEANVTRIFNRRELHLLIDLAFHSVLYFSFDGRRQNGWLNTLITGDSSQGKSEATLRLMEHYGLGIRHDCKNATVAGLLGGLQQLGSRWFVSWGAIPCNDRRLVVMEEIKGASTEVIGKLTDMRSSGIADISKIEKRRAHARTRLIMISNPRSDRPVAAYNFGIETIQELIGSLEDIRRFDLAAILSAVQIDPETINKLSTSRPECEHKYTAELCKRKVLWCWTRTSDQVRFEKGSLQLCLKYATELCSRFSESLPLCDRGTMRYKIARMAIALAGMTFSSSNDYEAIYIRKAHIEYIVRHLIQQYSDPVFGYEDFSKAQIFANSIIDPDIIRRNILVTKYPKDLVQQLLHSKEITLADISDWTEADRDIAQRLLSFLVRKHAIYRHKRWYLKTSGFIDLLKKLQIEKLPEESVQPKEEF